MRTHSSRHRYRSSQVREVPPLFVRTRSCRPFIAGLVWSPGGSVGTIEATSLEAPCRACTLEFVATLWPLYPDHGEMPRTASMIVEGYNYRPFRVYGLSCNFIEMHTKTAWGARGPEFKSRRSDQSKQSL